MLGVLLIEINVLDCVIMFCIQLTPHTERVRYM